MKKKFLKLLIVLSSAIILIALLFFTNSFGELVHIFKSANLYWLAVAFGCMVMYWLLDALLLHETTIALFEKVPFKVTIRFTMIGQFFNAITPFAGAGQPVQAYVMIKDGIKPGHTASILILKTMLHQLVIILYSIVAFIFTFSLFKYRIPHFYLFFILGLAINLAFMLFYGLFFYNREAAEKVLNFIIKILKKVKFVKNIDNLQGKIQSELSSFSEGAKIIKNDISVLIKLIIIQIIQFTFYFIIPYFIHLAVETNSISVWDMIFSQAMIILISLLVPSPGATGGIEGLSYLFYGMFFKQGLIIPVILIYRLITYYASVVVGGLFALYAPEKPLKRST